MKQYNTAYLKIKRQASPDEKPYWESFSLKYDDGDTILSLLERLESANQHNQVSTPVHHECNCREEICGTCTIIINRKPRLSCSTLVKDLPVSSEKKPIVLEPLKKFSVIRDLTVDRSRLSRSLTRIKNWVAADFFLDANLKYAQGVQQEMYSYAKCIKCGSCYEACPRTDKTGNRYMGPLVISQAVMINDHPNGKDMSEDRMETIMEKDGIQNCGKSMNCQKVCPKNVPLVRSLTRANRAAMKKLFKNN